MKRLYDISYNEEQWKISGSRNAGYNLVHKETFSSYSLRGSIIGIEQIADLEFLVYRQITYDEWQICRIKFDVANHKAHELYCKNFCTFDFLTEDIIIFDKNYPVLGATLYSISNNKESDTLNHILSSEPDCRLIKNRKIVLIYDKPNETNYPCALYVEYKFDSYPLDICAYLQVVLDANTLKPIFPIFSTLRNKYFYEDDAVTLGQIAKEDSRYAKIIGKFLDGFYSKDNRKDLLRACLVD